MKEFNIWLYEKWQEHCEEIIAFTHQMPNYMMQQYFETYKIWLESEYQRVMKEDENGNGEN